MNEELMKVPKLETEKTNTPAFVEAEKMFEKLADISRETAARAYDYFIMRGSQLGTHFEDWLRAESEVLRSAPAEIKETKNLIKVRLAVPGFKTDDISISLKGNDLIVSGETNIEESDEDESVFYSEWRSDRFLRHLTLPCEVETDNVEAKLKDGILALSLRKKAEEEAVKVAVKAA